MEYQKNTFYTKEQHALMTKVFIGDDISPMESPTTSYDENSLIAQAIFDSKDDEDILRYLLTLENLSDKKIDDVMKECHFEVKQVVQEYKNNEIDAKAASKKIIKSKSMAQIIEDDTF